MSVQYKQEGRLLQITTPLGKDVMLLRAFSGREEISRLFRFQLELLSMNHEIKPADLVGKAVTWFVEPKDGQKRYFNGFVNRLAAGGTPMRGYRAYRAEIVPWFWFLTRTANCRIFQNKTVPDIIKQVFGDFGFSDFEMKTKTHPKWEYCVQYRETAFNFISRLMEQEGIFYFFTHEDGKHTMNIGDDKALHKDVVENRVRFFGGTLAPNHISSWEHQWEFRPGKWTQTDYNFETPSTSLLVNSPTKVKLPGNTKYEIFDYPGEYEDKGVGEGEVELRMQEEEVAHDVVTGTSQCTTFVAGGKFGLTGHDVETENKKYVLLTVQHSGADYSYTNEAVGAEYNNTFTCFPDSVPFRPSRVTPKPMVQGPQTAVVVGPKGEEIYTDKYGRIKVQFFWDREGKKDENSSCWIRVAQFWAGKRWGASFWPRIGQEVVVDFLEGDPDRPLCTGSVYNAEQMPPYQGGGPDAKHANDNKVSGIKTNSTKGGAGYNEIRFDDTKQAEQLFMHAQKDYELRIKHDRVELIGNEHHMILGPKGGEEGKGDMFEFILGNRNMTIAKNLLVLIGGNIGIIVGGSGGGGQGGGGGPPLIETQFDKITKHLGKQDVHMHLNKNRMQLIDLNQSMTIKKDRKEKVEGKSSEEIVGNRIEKVGGAYSLEVVGASKAKVTGNTSLEVVANRNEKVGGNYSLEVVGNQNEKVTGNVSLDIAGKHIIKVTGASSCDVTDNVYIKGKEVVIEGLTALTIKVGGSFVNLSPGSVNIVGPIVNINSGGAAGAGVAGTPAAPTAPEAPEAVIAPDPPEDPAPPEAIKPRESDDSASGKKSAP